jgi:hypothetical protein
MALDVWIGEPTRFKGGPAVSFEPEAYYWFLYPLFEEFARLHGQMIDPYDGAAFLSTELAPVLKLVDDAEAMIAAQPSEFRVHIGTNLGTSFDPKNEAIYHTVKRDEYLKFIGKLHAAVLQAQKTGERLVFFGD